MLYKLPLKNTDKMLLVSEDGYKLITENTYFQALKLLENLRIHSYGYAFFQKNFPKKDGSGYNNTTIYIHRHVAENLVKKPTDVKKRLLVTFKNGDRLDCRTKNIIWATSSEIIRNIPFEGNTDSSYRGVYRLPSGNFRAAIFRGKQPHELGIFPTAELAALAYNRKSIEWFGKTRSLNKIDQEKLHELLKKGKIKQEDLELV